MRFKKTIILTSILILFCIASFVVGIKYNSNQKLNQDRKYYLNHFYFQLNSTIDLLSSVNDWGSSIHKADITVNPYIQLLTELDSMELTNEHGSFYMRNYKDSHFLNDLALSFESIENKIRGSIYWDNQDRNLLENEYSFLINLRQDLQSMKSDLYSEETKQENPNLTMGKLCEIVKPFTAKYR